MSKYIPGLVSIIIPTYKRSEMLLRAIESARLQTYSNIEILVVDDNITGDDYSLDLRRKLSTINDDRVILVEQEKHINGAAARNAGIRKAKGEFVSFLDDDDVITPDKIELQVNVFGKLDDSWGAVTCLKKIYKDGELVKATIPYKDGFIFEDIVSFMTNVTTGTALIRRKALDEAGYWDESLKRNQDIQLFSFLSNKYKIRLVRRYLLLADISDDQNRVQTIDDYLKIKENFYKSVGVLTEKLNASKQKKIMATQQMFVGVHYLRCRLFREGLRIIFKAFSNKACTILYFFKYLFRGILESKAGKLLCKIWEKKNA